MSVMAYTGADRFLMLLRDNPTLMPPAPSPAPASAMERRSRDEAHRCLRCGERSATAMIADTKAGPRWLDLCMPDYVWMLGNATQSYEWPTP